MPRLVLSLKLVLVALALVALALVALALGVQGASAQRPAQPLDEPLAADLDGDGVREVVRARETSCFGPDGEVPPPCPPSAELRTLVIEVIDDCAGGPHVLTLSREMEGVSLGRLVDADGDGTAAELAFEVRAGAAARGIQAKVVSFRPGAGGCVAVRRTLFSYPRTNTIGQRPPGASFASGSMELRDFTKRFAGIEVRTRDTYALARDPGCCPSYERVTFWRFVTATSRYKPFRTKLTRLH